MKKKTMKSKKGKHDAVTASRKYHQFLNTWHSHVTLIRCSLSHYQRRGNKRPIRTANSKVVFFFSFFYLPDNSFSSSIALISSDRMCRVVVICACYLHDPSHYSIRLAERERKDWILLLLLFVLGFFFLTSPIERNKFIRKLFFSGR